MSVVHVSYYTDPACPWSWALEPTLRRLGVEFGDQLSFTYVMAGLHREVADGPAAAGQWLEAAADSGMPVDARLWLEAPPRSSHPACMAVKAAAEQGEDTAGLLLRRLREGFAIGRRKLDGAEALLAEGRLVSGLDVQRFEIDLGSHAILESFGADLERARSRAPAAERVPLPSLEFAGESGEVHGVYGSSPYEVCRAAAIAGGAKPSEAGPPGVEDALRRFGCMATAEVAEVCRLPGPRAPAELWRLAEEWRVRGEPAAAGVMWSLA